MVKATGRPPASLLASFFLLGYCTLAPITSYLSSLDYFNQVFQDYDAARFIWLAYTGMSTCSVLFNVLFPVTDKGTKRISIGLFIFIVVLLVIPIMDLADMKEKHGVQITFVILIITAALSGMAGGLIEGSAIAACFSLPKECCKMYVPGLSFAAVINIAIKCLTKLTFLNSDNGLRISTCILFFYAASVGVVTLVVKKTIIDYYLAEQDEKSVETLPLIEPDLPRSYGSENSLRRLIEISKKLKVAIGLIMVIFATTLAIYPGIPSDAENDALGSWYPLMLTAFYETSNFIGRMMPHKLLIRNLTVISLSTFCRILVIPAGFSIARYCSTPITLSLLMIAAGASEGYCTVCTMDIAHSLLHESESEFIGGNILGFFIQVGLAIGAVLSIALSHFV